MINSFVGWLTKNITAIRKTEHTVIHSPYFIDVKSDIVPLYHCSVYIRVVTPDINGRGVVIHTLNLN